MANEKMIGQKTPAELAAILGVEKRFWRRARRVHGGLCLALRHPDLGGAVRATLVPFVKGLGQGLVELGVLTPEELELVEQTEAEAAPHGGLI